MENRPFSSNKINKPNQNPFNYRKTESSLSVDEDIIVEVEALKRRNNLAKNTDLKNQSA